MTDIGPVLSAPAVMAGAAPIAGEITFYTPGFRRYKTAEFGSQNVDEFVSISLTGTACVLGCEHCNRHFLEGMTSLPHFDGTLFELCAMLKKRGARGVLISGGCDARGRVPLRRHLSDLVRARRELGLTLRVHPGLPDDRTVAGLAEAGVDGAMVDIIGDDTTIQQVYHLNATTADYEAVLARLERFGVPAVPHIILGLHYGHMHGEQNALAMIARHARKALVLVVLTPISGTPMVGVQPPSMAEIAEFFALARRTLPDARIMLGCARPLGKIKLEIDRAALDAGLNAIAYPANGIIHEAEARGLNAHFVNACCGVSWS